MKIGFAILGFFYDLIWILQGTGSTGENWRIYFSFGPWKVYNFTQVPSLLAEKTPGGFWLHSRAQNFEYETCLATYPLPFLQKL
jgi:hypothetical protein